MVNINKEKIKEFLKPTRTKIIITLIPALAVLSFFAIEVNYYKIHMNAWGIWFGKSLEVLPFYILLWYIISCLITKTKRKINLSILLLIMILSIIFITNLPSFIIDYSVRGLPCETREDCQSICEEMCKYDIFDRILYGPPACTISPCLSITNCENGKCTGCDCCWGCEA